MTITTHTFGTRLLTMFIVLLVGGVARGQATQPASQPSDQEAEVRDALHQIISVAKNGEIEALSKLLAGIPAEAPADRVRPRVERLAQFLTKGLDVITIRTLDEAAVVVIDDNPAPNSLDIDPVFLVRDGESWKLLWTITSFDPGRTELTDAQRANLATLKEWLDSQKEVLRQEWEEKRSKSS